MSNVHWFMEFGVEFIVQLFKKNVLQFHAYSHIHKWLTRYSNTASETHNWKMNSPFISQFFFVKQ